MCVKLQNYSVRNLVKMGDEVTEAYKNFIVDEVNESCLRLAVFSGEFKWHYHNSDELFIVLEGELMIDFQDGTTISLKPHDMVTVPAGTVHRTRANVRTVNLCFEHTDANTVIVESFSGE